MGDSMKQRMNSKEVQTQELQLLMENEAEVNRQATRILFVFGVVFIPFVFLLRFLGFFIFYIDDGLIPLIITALILIVPEVLSIFNSFTKSWYKYIVVAAMTLCLPSIYLAFDYMVLMLWVVPILTSCLYFNKRFNAFTLMFTITVLGFTSYYRSYKRMLDGLISERIGGLFKDFLVSYTTYTLLTCVLFIFIAAITKKANVLLYDMIKSKQYERMSIMDGLTGIFNYRYLITALERNKLEFDRSKTPFSIIVFDVDHFKHINDTYGHIIGDQALIQISNCLKNSVRENDIVGRYGGEEFIVVFPKTTSDDAYMISERCREAISKITIEDFNLKLTVSGGIQEYTGGSISEMINRADMKMYYAKSTGRNKVETICTQSFQTV